MVRSLFLALTLACAMPVAALAQGTSVAFGASDFDASQPVEISADTLTVDQSDGSAVFSGNVIVVQGVFRLAAADVRVEYSEDGDGIDRLLATGGVTLVSGAEAAEAQDAEYRPDTGVVVLTGEVLLTQGNTAISGERLVVDLNAGTGRIEGRVRTVLQTGRE